LMGVGALIIMIPFDNADARYPSLLGSCLI
jgi:hypothetical protein